MFGLPLAFAAPAVLVALAGLGALYYLLRVTPPPPRRVPFPPLRLLMGLAARETEPARTPWPILALRLAVAALIIVAMAEPLWRNLVALEGSGPLLVLFDDGWPAAGTFEKRVEYAREQMLAAARAGRPVAIKPFSEGGRDIVAMNAGEIEGRLRSLAPAPFAPSRDAAAAAIERYLAATPGADVLWIADGVELGGAHDFAARLSKLARPVDVVADGSGVRAVAGADNEAGSLKARLIRSDTAAPASGVVRALDAQGREIGRAPFDFGAKLEADVRFDLPVELRNEVQRLAIDGDRSAGAVWLLDDSARRRRVAIASGATADTAQPLIAPSYYIRRALAPYADVSEWRDSASDPIVSLLAEKPSVLVLADMSVAPGPERDAIGKFLDDGGVLVRFAGARLAAGDDDLTPTALRRGGRTLGGALSWETPKHVAPFDKSSPFFGLAVPDEVTISRQVLAEPEQGLVEKTWARLADGTPLVTAARRGKGLIVLFHVTADTTWSNLPLSGLFVDMLRRVVAEAGSARSRSRRQGRARRRREPSTLANAERLRRARRPACASPADRRRLRRRRRRRASAGPLRRRGVAHRRQRAGAGTGDRPRRLRPAQGPFRRARRRPAGRFARLAAAPRAPRPDDRRARLALARRRLGMAPRRRDRGHRRRRGARRCVRPAPGPRRRHAGQRPRHGFGPLHPARLCDDRRRHGRRDLAPRALGADPRPVEPHLGGARRTDRRRPGARRTGLLPAPLLADRGAAGPAVASGAVPRSPPT